MPKQLLGGNHARDFEFEYVDFEPYNLASLSTYSFLVAVSILFFLV